MSVYCGEALQCTCKNLKKFSVYSFRVGVNVIKDVYSGSRLCCRLQSQVTSSNAHGVSKFSAISIFKTAPSEPGVL